MKIYHKIIVFLVFALLSVLMLNAQTDSVKRNIYYTKDEYGWYSCVNKTRLKPESFSEGYLTIDYKSLKTKLLSLFNKERLKKLQNKNLWIRLYCNFIQHKIVYVSIKCGIRPKENPMFKEWDGDILTDWEMREIEAILKNNAYYKYDTKVPIKINSFTEYIVNFNFKDFDLNDKKLFNMGKYIIM